MSWAAVLVLGAGAYFFKVLGLVIVGGRPLPPRLQACLALIPAAMLSALIVSNTVTVGQHLVIDARLPGVLAAALAAWRKLPFPAVIAIGAGVTALVRAFVLGRDRAGADSPEIGREAAEGALAGDGRLGPVEHQVEHWTGAAGGTEGGGDTRHVVLVALDPVAGDGRGHVVEQGREGGEGVRRGGHGSTVRTTVHEVQRLIAVISITYADDLCGSATSRSGTSPPWRRWPPSGRSDGRPNDSASPNPPSASRSPPSSGSWASRSSTVPAVPDRWS